MLDIFNLIEVPQTLVIYNETRWTRLQDGRPKHVYACIGLEQAQEGFVVAVYTQDSGMKESFNFCAVGRKYPTVHAIKESINEEINGLEWIEFKELTLAEQKDLPENTLLVGKK